jgi:threonine synthase
MHWHEIKMTTLECVFCDQRRPFEVYNPFCPACGAPMLVHFSRAKRGARPSAPTAAERFADFLPLKKYDPALSLGVGGTPLLLLGRIVEQFGLPEIYAKNEMTNPTASFKDRGTVVAVQKVLELGIKKIGTISTGNMAGSTAAYAAKAGLKCLVFVKEDTPPDKIVAAAVYGATIIKVTGDYGGLFRKSFEIGRRLGIAFMNSVDPFRIEGYKVTSYEIFEQLGHSAFRAKAPVMVFVPVSAAGHLIGLIRGFRDLHDLGLIPRLPTIIGVQASGCAPIARAFRRGFDRVERFPNPRTIAHAISNPTPPGGNLALRLLREAGGLMMDVGDPEIRRAQSLLASREGLFCDPASVTPLAAVLKLQRRKRLPAQARAVLVVTGSGLKSLEAVDAARLDIRSASLEKLDAAL